MSSSCASECVDNTDTDDEHAADDDVVVVVDDDDADNFAMNNFCDDEEEDDEGEDDELDDMGKMTVAYQQQSRQNRLCSKQDARLFECEVANTSLLVTPVFCTALPC